MGIMQKLKLPCARSEPKEKLTKPVCYCVLLFLLNAENSVQDKEYRKGVHTMETLRLRRAKTLEAGYTVCPSFLCLRRSNAYLRAWKRWSMKVPT